MPGLEIQRGPNGVEIFTDPSQLIRVETRDLVTRVEQLEQIVTVLQEQMRGLLLGAVDDGK